MKKTQRSGVHKAGAQEMRREYHFDYQRARPNRFAGRARNNVVVLLDPDIARVFKTPESVNNVLRALIKSMPLSTKS